MSQGQVNVHLVGGGVSVPTGHGHVMSSEGMTLRCASDDGVGGSRRDGSYNGGKVAAAAAAGSCKLNFSASASGNLNHDKTLENNNTSSRGEGAVDSWICSSD